MLDHSGQQRQLQRHHWREDKQPLAQPIGTVVQRKAAPSTTSAVSMGSFAVQMPAATLPAVRPSKFLARFDSLAANAPTGKL
jgi:hypothetical protein